MAEECGRKGAVADEGPRLTIRCYFALDDEFVFLAAFYARLGQQAGEFGVRRDGEDAGDAGLGFAAANNFCRCVRPEEGSTNRPRSICRCRSCPRAYFAVSPLLFYAKDHIELGREDLDHPSPLCR